MNHSDLAAVDGSRGIVSLIGLDKANDVVDLERIQLSFELGRLAITASEWRRGRGSEPSPRIIGCLLLFDSLEDAPGVGRSLGIDEIHSVLCGLEGLVGEAVLRELTGKR
jgi:hypothetical protein